MVDSTTEKSVDVLLKQSFIEMQKMVEELAHKPVREVEEDLIRKAKLHSVMFTISTSYFRLALLLHYKEFSQIKSLPYEFLKEFNNDPKKYNDFVCELGNNFCGSACRILNSKNITTGMSTPFILENHDSASTLVTLDHDCKSSIGIIEGKLPLIAASICMFSNKGKAVSLDISQMDITAETESSGELEFF